MVRDIDTGRAALRARLRALRQRARQAFATARPPARRTTVDARANIVVATHAGEEGASTSVSARQMAPIRQDNPPQEEGDR